MNENKKYTLLTKSSLGDLVVSFKPAVNLAPPSGGWGEFLAAVAAIIIRVKQVT